MEFPELGQHCCETSCNRLDFLPMKCDACKKIFCKDHFQYVAHSCTVGISKNVQVPVCPLCNRPVPSRRGDPPDVAVSSHIDRECRSDPAQAKRKAFTNRCSLKGCKQKELIAVYCRQCGLNHCLKHRHPDDHNCTAKVLSPAGAAAMARIRQRPTNTLAQAKATPQRACATQNCVGASAVQGNLTEDEALALALQQSLYEAESQEQRSIPSPHHSRSRVSDQRDKSCSVS